MKLIKLIIVCLSLGTTVTVITRPEDVPILVEDTKKKQIDEMIETAFSMDIDVNVALKALNEMPDRITKPSEIDQIFGTNYSSIEQQAEVLRVFALNLTKDEINGYIDTKPYENPQLHQIFSDFLAIIDLRLDPNTLLINKDTYIFFYEINEAHLTGAFTKLMDYYSRYTPIEHHIEKSKRKYISKVHTLVQRKCPQYENKEVEHPDYHNVIDLAEGTPIGGGTSKEEKVDMDLAKVKNLFHVMNLKDDKEEAQVLAQRTSAFIQAIPSLLIFFIV